MHSSSLETLYNINCAGGIPEKPVWKQNTSFPMPSSSAHEEPRNLWDTVGWEGGDWGFHKDLSKALIASMMRLTNLKQWVLNYNTFPQYNKQRQHLLVCCTTTKNLFIHFNSAFTQECYNKIYVYDFCYKYR